MDKIKIGKCYRMRNGQETPPLEVQKNGTNYKYGAWIQESQYAEGDLSYLSWLETGDSMFPGYGHAYDLIEEL